MDPDVAEVVAADRLVAEVVAGQVVAEVVAVEAQESSCRTLLPEAAALSRRARCLVHLVVQRRPRSCSPANGKAQVL